MKHKTQFASFIETRDDIYAALIALRSLQALKIPEVPVLLIIPQPVLERFNADFSQIDLSEQVEALGGRLVSSFPNGFKAQHGFRPVLKKIIGNASSLDEILYFSARTVFWSKEITRFLGNGIWAARQPGNLWPHTDLYGPKLDEIWQTVLDLSAHKLEDWIDESQPNGYWRRYPTASPHLFCIHDPTRFLDVYSEYNDKLYQETPKVLQGYDRVPPEAVILATISKLDGQIIDPQWDEVVNYYPNFYNLILRLTPDQLDWLRNCVWSDPPLRQVLKLTERNKIIFYQKSLLNVRERLDDIERFFSVTRMQELIQRRGIKKRIENQARKKEEEKAQV